MTLDDLYALPVEALPDALAALRETERRPLLATLLERRNRRHDERWALLLCGLAGSAKRLVDELPMFGLDDETERRAVEVLDRRRPAWLAKLPAALATGWGVRDWRLVRGLVRAGAIERPDDEVYLRGMVTGLARQWPLPARRVVDELRADPDLLVDDVWAMLAFAGSAGALAGFDRPTAYGDVPDQPDETRTWRHALVTLAAEGTIDRDRLLDTVLAAFLRDWAAADLGWFPPTHAALAPTLDEVVARQATYTRLLTVAYGPAVALAQQALGTLLKAGRLDADALLAVTPAVVARADKGPVLTQLRLLRDLVKARPDLADAVADAARGAAEHDRADVRERAVALVGTAPARPVVVASTPPPRPEPRAVTPVADADELAELFARLIEEADDPIEVERALDGVVRLAGKRPRHGGEALAERARTRLGELYPGAFAGEEVRADLAALARVWLLRVRPPRDIEAAKVIVGDIRRTLGAAVSERVLEVARLVHGGGGRLLALPTSSDGRLDPAVLAARVREVGRTAAPARWDVTVAALRVAPGAAVALPSAHRTARALGDALGVVAAYRPDWTRETGAWPSEWLAKGDAVVWRDRSRPYADEWRVLDRHDPLRDIRWEARLGEWSPRFGQVAALWPLLLPHHPETLAAQAHPQLDRGLRATRSAVAPLLDALACSRVPTGPVTCSALALGLAVNDAGDRTHAVDAIVDLAYAGLLDAPELGRQVRLCLDGSAVVGSRPAAGLAEVARAGGAASAAVLAALREVLPALPGRRDAHAFVDLLATVAVDNAATVALPEELAALARGRSSSALAAACRRVPA